ncbi:MAG: class II aldolase/adducin family protein [Archaeoglobaceae archaeon]
MIEEAIEVGRLLFRSGLIDGASGNLSFREGDRIVITRSGAALYDLKPEDFVEVSSEKASTDRLVHKKIYEISPFSCVLHCHGVFNVVLSLKLDRIVPADLEGRLFFGELEVVDGEFGSESYAEKVAEVVSRRKIAIARGHGIYVAANDFREAFNLANYAEHSCEVLYYLKLLDKLEHRESREKF